MTHSDTIAAALWAPTGRNRKGRALAIILAGVALLAVSARINVPLYPVPLTMQTFAVLALAMFCGWRYAVSAVVAYLAIGAIGMPVFAAGGGVAYLTGPTAGFLLGFVPAAFVAGWFAQRGADKGFFRALAVLVFADAIIFLCGVGWLAGFMPGGFGEALQKGMLPFVVGDIGKMVLAAAAVVLCRRRARG